MRGVPFDIERSSHGLTRSKGVLRVDAEHLIFEVQTTLLGLYHRSPERYRLELTDLEEVRYKRGLLRDRLTIRTQPLDRITKLPGAADGELRLRIRRADRRAVEPILDHLHLWRTNET